MCHYEIYYGGFSGFRTGFISFHVYLDSGISCDVSKFAYDTSIGRVIRSNHDVEVLKKKKLTRLFEWSEKWQM